jgi:hypothetical protein
MIYVYIDTDKTQDYVFAGRRLRSIRNASRALEDADQEVGKLFGIPGTKIRASGGVVVARFDGDKAKDKAQAFTRKARKEYRKWEIGVTAMSYELAGPVNDFYSDVLRHLLKDVRRLKDSPKDVLAAPPASIHAVPCEVTGMGSAEDLLNVVAGEQPWRVRAVERNKWFELQVDDAEQFLGAEARDLLLPDDADQLVRWSKKDNARELPQPGTSEERLVAVVFADVNALGEQLPHIACREDCYAAFATDLRKTIVLAIAAAVKEVLLQPVRDAGARVVPFRVLYLGGDDLCFMVLARFAVPFVQKMIERFEAESASLMATVRRYAAKAPDHLTISAGIAIAPHKYPILAFRRIGLGLERRCKVMGRAWQGMHQAPLPPSLVDFHVVKNGAVGDAELLRESDTAPTRPGTSLHGGPYAVSDCPRFLSLDALLLATKSLVGFEGRSKLKEIGGILRARDADLRYSFWHERLDKRQRSAWKDACNALAIGCEMGKLPFAEGTRHNTPILDALDLLDLR